MRILYVSQYYPPEMGAPSARVSELARHWVEAGHEVTVLTGFPNHPTGVVPPEYRRKLWRGIVRERDGGVEVVRTWLWPLPNRKSHERIRNYASFCWSAALTGSFLRRPDVVIGTSPQLLVGLSAWWISRVKRAPFVFEVRDLWPESLAAVAVAAEDSAMIRTLRRISGFLYRRASHIAVVTPAFKTYLAEKWGVPPEKMTVVENGVETELFCPQPASSSTRAQFGTDGRFVVSYVGTHGNAAGLDTLLGAAEALRSRVPDVLVLLVGEGAEKERLVGEAKRRGLANVRFVDQLPRSEVPQLLNASDVCLVLLRPSEVFKTVIPTKMLEMMSCGRPVILGVDGQAREILDKAGGGVAVAPGNAKELADAIVRLHDDPQRRQRLGESGRRYVVEHLSRSSTAAQYVELLKVVSRKS